MNYKFLLVLSIVLLAGLASAGYSYDDNAYYYKEKISKTYYDSDEDSALTRTIYVNYKNEDRYSTHDYRWGYSYRETEPYWRTHHDFEDPKTIRLVDVKYDYDRDDRHFRYSDYDHSRYDDYGNYYRYSDYDGGRRFSRDRRYDKYDDDRFFKTSLDYDDWRYVDSRPRVQARYIPYLDDYEFQECYDYAPRGKLFYIECD